MNDDILFCLIIDLITIIVISCVLNGAADQTKDTEESYKGLIACVAGVIVLGIVILMLSVSVGSPSVYGVRFGG